MTYRLTYDPSPSGDGSMGLATWEKSLEELLTPNGTEPLLVWMLRESDARGGAFKLERVQEFTHHRWMSNERTDDIPYNADRCLNCQVRRNTDEGALSCPSPK